MVGWIVSLATSEQDLAAAAATFLAHPTLARSTRRSYEQTLSWLVDELGGDRPLAALRACASRRSWAAAGAAVPAVVDPVATQASCGIRAEHGKGRVAVAASATPGSTSKGAGRRPRAAKRLLAVEIAINTL